MSPYIPAIVWLVGIVVCMIIAKRRNVTPNFFWQILVVSLGPLAIPLVFFAKPDQEKENNRT